MKRTILQMGHPLLTTPSEEIQEFTRAREVADDLRDTLQEFRRQNLFGRGISAPQIGESIRLCWIDVGEPLELYNPRIVRREGVLECWDDCFSFPDLLVWVARARRVTVAYQNFEGAPQQLEAEMDLAELLQHEIDHLDGVLAVQRATDSAAFCLRREFVRQKKTKWAR